MGKHTTHSRGGKGPSVLQQQADKVLLGARKTLGRSTPVKSEARRKHLFVKGQSGNPRGRTPGAKNVLTKYREKILAKTGMMPLDFLFAVFRDELYDDYDVQRSVDGRNSIFTPKKDAAKLKVTLDQRLGAASTAAPYVHRKMPVGIEGTPGRPIALIQAEALRGLPAEELDLLLKVMAKMNISEQLGDEVPTYNEQGELVRKEDES